MKLLIQNYLSDITLAHHNALKNSNENNPIELTDRMLEMTGGGDYFGPQVGTSLFDLPQAPALIGPLRLAFVIDR